MTETRNTEPNNINSNNQKTTEAVVETVDSAQDKRLSFENFSYLSRYATPVKKPVRAVLGREAEMKSLLASLSRVEVSNAILLGDPGSGKTMLVQGISMQDPERLYLEIDLSKMAASENGEDGAVQMASRLKGLFDDAERYRDEMAETDAVQARELVLFIDEFHLITQLSTAATEAIKPALADSGTRGIKIIAATTFGEFNDYVSDNQALVERLQRINVREPKRDVVISILKSMAKEYGVSQSILDRTIFDAIYDYSNRYIPANSQPRKSILILDAMIGWHKMFKVKLNKHLLADVIFESSGVNVAFDVDGRHIKKELNERVYDQKFAVDMIERRLQIAVADLHDKSRPMSSFLFTGPSGVGKTELAKGLANLLFGNEESIIRFDMSEYSMRDSVERFRTELTMRVWQQPYSIILFDEIEKAESSVTRLLLQVLDDARLTDKNNREVSFKNAYIILTTNAGQEIYRSIAQYVDSADGEKGLSEYTKIIRTSLINNESFSPELINRLDAIIPFAALKEDTMKKIIQRKLDNFIKEVKDKHGVRLVLHKDVLDYLVHENVDTDTNAGGARGIVRRMSTEVVSTVARFINTYPKEKNVGVIISGSMQYRNKNQLKSTAYVTVGTATSRTGR